MSNVIITAQGKAVKSRYNDGSVERYLRPESIPVYVAVDHSSGGIPYWSNSFTNVRMFETTSEAVKFFNSATHYLADRGYYEIDKDTLSVEMVTLTPVKKIEFPEETESIVHELAH